MKQRERTSSEETVRLPSLARQSSPPLLLMTVPFDALSFVDSCCTALSPAPWLPTTVFRRRRGDARRGERKREGDWSSRASVAGSSARSHAKDPAPQGSRRGQRAMVRFLYHRRVWVRLPLIRVPERTRGTDRV